MNRHLPLIVLLSLLLAGSAFAQTSAFTYQGRLNDGGPAANGSYDMQFRLYDGANVGAGQIGSTITNSTVQVTAGIFTVELDFGAPAFPKEERWIEISIRPTGNPGGYTQLLPRNHITSVPYAVKAASANTVATTSGNTVIQALNDPSTNTTINDTALPANLVRIKPAAPQNSVSANNNGSEPLIDLHATVPSLPSQVADFRLYHGGTLISTGFVRDVGNTTGCAAQLPITGAGTRFMWFPCRGSLRFGRVPTAQTNWDDANMDDFTFAGGNQVVASGYGAFAYGDQVTVSSTVGVGFGSAVTVSGTAGFSSGASNVCSGFACTAMGYTTRSGGQGSVALGYRTEAAGDNSVTLGYRATNCTTQVSGVCSGTNYVGTILLAGTSDPSNQTGFMHAQHDGEMRVRAPGGVYLRTSFASDANAGAAGNTGCDLPAGSGTFSCSSSRTIKENFLNIDRNKLLLSIRNLPMTTWSYKLEGPQSRHIGPVAEDFYDAFKFGQSDKSVPVQDLAGVSLVGVQALEARTAELQAENSALKARVDEMNARLAQIEKGLAAHKSHRRRR